MCGRQFSNLARRAVVSEESAEHLRQLIPHAEVVDIQSTGHMVAGDRNDHFNAAVLAFLRRHPPG
ncbi:MAG: alpha/beta fold hydrolase [Nevskiales bacterium]